MEYILEQVNDAYLFKEKCLLTKQTSFKLNILLKLFSMLYATSIKIGINFGPRYLFIFSYGKVVNDKEIRLLILTQNQSRQKG
jgi:hypothetical protein